MDEYEQEANGRYEYNLSLFKTHKSKYPRHKTWWSLGGSWICETEESCKEEFEQK